MCSAHHLWFRWHLKMDNTKDTCYSIVMQSCRPFLSPLPLEEQLESPSNTIRLGEVQKLFFDKIGMYYMQAPCSPTLLFRRWSITAFDTVLLEEVVSSNKHGSFLNLVLFSPLTVPCIWPDPHWWPDNQKAKERGSRGEEEIANENPKSKTKIGRFSG